MLFMDNDEELKREYLLLRNYLDEGFKIRKTLLRIQLQNLQDLESDKWLLSDSGGLSKNALRSCIQIDLISKIMMLIEDLAVISESCRQKKGFYKLLDKSTSDSDLGDLIKSFFNNLENFSDVDFREILSYMDPDKIKTTKHSIQFLKKYQKENIKSIRSMFYLISIFGKEHHPVFRRYKHAGIPIHPGIKVDAAGLHSEIDFQTFIGVSKGDDPILDSYILPYSIEVILGYKIIVGFIHTLLDEIIHHRIESIERGIAGILPYRPFTSISSKETKTLKKLYALMETQYPTKISPDLTFHIDCDPNDISWYLTLPMMLKEYKKINENNKNIKKFMIKEFNVQFT